MGGRHQLEQVVAITRCAQHNLSRRDISRCVAPSRDKHRPVATSRGGLGVGTRPHHSTTARPLRFPHAALSIVAVASAHQGRPKILLALLTRRLPTAWASLTLERCSGRSSYQPTELTLYAYARHAVANCPQGQLRDPTPPRGRGAYGVVAKGDAHAALALPATLDRARRVALAGAATTRWRHSRCLIGGVVAKEKRPRSRCPSLAQISSALRNPDLARGSGRGFRTLMAAASNVFFRCDA